MSEDDAVRKQGAEPKVPLGSAPRLESAALSAAGADAFGATVFNGDHRPPLSCYIRTLNEERLIGEVVAAALRIAREVIVVDSGSTDATVERAAEAGADVRHQDWLGNGRQKRAGEELCAYDWLLDLDADEVVTPELAAEIAALFKTGAPAAQTAADSKWGAEPKSTLGSAPARSVYTVPLVTAPPVGQPWRGTDVARRAKLYDRRMHRMPDHAAWDQLELKRGTKIGRLKGALLHYSF
ncbi:MAG: glycosyltransferase family 2 protein, partial [Maricaulaceae bacterium]